MNTTRKAYPSDVTDDDWAFLVPYLTLMREDAPQRGYPLRELFNALRYVVKTSCQWRFLPHDFPPWTAVYQQARRWIDAEVFEQIAHDLRVIVRFVGNRDEQPRQRSSMHVLCNQRPRAVVVPDMMEPRRRKVRRSTSRLIPWEISWR